jgi:CTP:phosphocholine cytidylyltransferase-like protein
MAGLGDRFKKAGYEKPKPFIDVGGQKMINKCYGVCTDYPFLFERMLIN